MSKQNDLFEVTIRRRLQKTARRISLSSLLSGLFITIGILTIVWIVLVAVEAGFWLDAYPRSIVFWIFIGLVIGLFILLTARPLLQFAGILIGPSEEVLARQIGRVYPEVSDRLVNLLHLVEGRSSEAPKALVDSAVQMLGNQVEKVPFELMEDFHRVWRYARLAAFPVLTLVVFLLSAPSLFLDASVRLLSPHTTFDRPAPFSLVVEPGSVEVPRNSDMDIVIHAEGGTQPRNVTLSLNNLDETLVEDIQLSADSAGIFSYTIVNVRRPFRYRVTSNPVETDWFTTMVIDRPIVRGLQVTLEYPEYTRIPPQRLEANIGDITALPGTRVDLRVGYGGHDIERAFLLFDDGTVDSLEFNDIEANGSFILTKDGSYQIFFVNEQGLENEIPIEYRIRLTADAFPSVTLLEPGEDAALNDDLNVILRYRIHDDYGFSRLSLLYRLSEQRFGAVTSTFDVVPLPVEDHITLDQEALFPWRLFHDTGLDLLPGDVVEYYLQVWDNDTIAGFKSARTATYHLRLPTLTEQYEGLDENQDMLEEDLEEMLRQSDEMRQQFEELREELRNKTDAEWEDERQLDQLQEKQERLEEMVESLADQMEAVSEQMEQNNLLSEQTLELYREVQKSFEEINSPELQEALQQLQQAVAELNLQQLQEGLQNFDFNEQQFRERLERALELFRNLRTQQKLEELAHRLETLAEREEKLQEETSRLDERLQDENETAGDDDRENEQTETDEQTDSSHDEYNDDDGEETVEEHRESLAKEQESASEEMRKIQEEMQSLADQMEEMSQSPSDEMEELSKEVTQQQIPEKMEQNAEQLRQNQFQDASEGQQQIQQQLESYQQQLDGMRTQMQGQQLQINIAGIRKILNDILTLSQDQEELRNLTRNNTSELLAMREDAQQQQELSEGLSIVIDSLLTLSKDIPEMSSQVQQQAGKALNAMGDAIGSMTERNVAEAGAYQKTSMMHLNELALLLSDLLNQLMNMANGAGGTSGMTMQQIIQQLQQMTGQQQQLNSQIQQFLNDLQGNKLSSDMEERLRQMAAQQEAIRRQLKQLNRQPEARGKVLGDLNKIAEQMEETIQELKGRRVTRQMIERQQQILTRLLDAQRSLRERGRERRRQGRSVDDILRQGPGALTPSEYADHLRRQLLRALESGYAPDFKALIKRYFELLQQQEVEEQ